MLVILSAKPKLAVEPPSRRVLHPAACQPSASVGLRLLPFDKAIG